MSRRNGHLLHFVRDRYGPIEVVEDGGVRALHFGSGARQSAMNLFAPERLELDYTRAMMTALLFQPQPQSALLVGLGGGSLAKFLLRHFPDCRVTVAELRPEVVAVARQWFDLAEEPRLTIRIGDGCELLAAAEERFDLLLLDAYDHAGMDGRLAEREFFDHCRCRLSADGVVAINLWRGDRELLKRALANLGEAFTGRTFLLPLEDKGNVVALAVAGALGWEGVRRLDRRARELEERLRIGLPRLGRRLRTGNPLKLMRSIW